MIIKTANATIGYDGLPVLSDVNVKIKRNSVLIGPNGSGKTTFLYAIIGLAKILSGYMEVFGIDIRDLPRNIKGITINLVDAYKILNLPVKDLTKIYSDLLGGDEDNAYKLFKYFNFNSFNKRLHQLSLGQQKIVANVFALAFKPRLALLDEPFENLDPAKRAKLLKLLNELKLNIILTTHEMELIKGLKEWDLYLVFNGKIIGAFRTEEIGELYISKGVIDGALVVINTDFGELSITKGYGEVPLSSIGDIENLFGVLDYDR